MTPHGVRPGAVLVDAEKIRAVVAADEVPADAVREDFGDLALLPGLVDTHVHINEPGRTEWEGFRTATQAAAAGGYTMLVDMPLNCIPATTSVEALSAKRNAASGQCLVDWTAWGGVVQGNTDQIEGLAGAGVRGFKCFLVPSGVDEFTMVSEADLRRALPHIAKSGLPLLVHAEHPDVIAKTPSALRDADWRQYPTYLRSRPAEAEVAAIEFMVLLCREYKFRLHIVHVATGLALEILRSARAERLDITAETCPHYLHLEAESIPDGATQFKCAPPIRSHPNRERLWEGLKDGTIDMIVSDHSPCPPEMKQAGGGNFRDAWGGIASLCLELPVVWSEARRRGFSLNDLVRWMAEAPAQLAGCDTFKGRIEPGYDADLVVFDPEAEFAVTPDRLYHRHPVSPYLGEKLCGLVKRTYLRGREVLRDGHFQREALGREVFVSRN
ncbi:MAG TPA: allantoinase AllB [Candidatus Solibacter sp.]|nr:allantoinase AllB [Candidatus Solibacter sp.]